jgi:hypothetical protein
MNCTLRPSGREGGDTELVAATHRKGTFEEERYQRPFVQTNKQMNKLQINKQANKQIH